MNLDDDIRDKLLRFLYARHRAAKGITKIPIGIAELRKEMKEQHDLKQNQVVSNLDYLIQVGWVREVIKERSFKTERGMEVSQEQVKYKISDVGINHLQSSSTFTRQDSFKNINITNVQGVTVVGEGNVVNTHYTDLSRALDGLAKAIAQSSELTDAQKLNAAGDVATIHMQIAKQTPNKSIVQSAWKAIQDVATVATVAEAAHQVGVLIAGLVN